MGFFASLGAVLLTIITTTVAIIAVLIGNIILGLYTIIEATVLFTAATGIFIVKTTVAALTLNIAGITATATTYFSTIGGLWTGTIASLAATWEAIHLTWNSLLSVMNFKVLSTINSIGLLVSEDYRQTMAKFWGKMGEIGNALGMGAGAFQIVMRMTEHAHTAFTVLSGGNFEIGKLNFVKTMQNWEGWEALKHKNQKMDLSEFFDWLDSTAKKAIQAPTMPKKRIVIKYAAGKRDIAMAPYPDAITVETRHEWPMVLETIEIPQRDGEFKDFLVGIYPSIYDGMGNTQKVLIGQIDVLTGMTDKLVDGYMILRDDIEDLKKVIPTDWADEIEKMQRNSLDRIDSFIAEEYYPVINAMKNEVTNFGRLLGDQQKNLDDISDQISKPGTMMSNVDHLDELSRIEEENKITSITNRPYERETEKTNDYIDSFQESVHDDFMNVSKPKEIIPFLGLEKEGTKIEPGEMDAGDNTWFVGDY